MHEICSLRLMYSEEVEARSNYKKSYLWGFRNSACGDWTSTAQKMKFSIRIYPVNVTKSDSVTFIEEILNGKRHFLRSVGVTGLKKTGLVYVLNLFGGRGKEKGWCDFVCVERLGLV